MAALRLFAFFLLGDVAAANPVPAPTPPPLPATEPVAPLGACTFTITSLDYGFTGHWAPTVTSTLYSITETVRASIDCEGCTKVAIAHARAPFWGGHGPKVDVTFVVAKGPTQVTHTVCAMTAKPIRPIPGAPSPDDSAQEKGQEANPRQVEPRNILRRAATIANRDPEPALPTAVPVAKEETETVYVATVTSLLYNPANCDNKKPGIPEPPPMMYRQEPKRDVAAAATATVFATKTIMIPRCDPTKQHTEEAPKPVEVEGGHVITPQGVTAPVCTSTTMVWPEIPDSTWTVYTRTAMYTHVVDCKSCALSWATGSIYFFAPMTYTSTITAVRPTTKTAFACRATGTARGAPVKPISYLPG
jgi:hypothetical protein